MLGHIETLTFGFRRVGDTTNMVVMSFLITEAIAGLNAHVSTVLAGTSVFNSLCLPLSQRTHVF